MRQCTKCLEFKSLDRFGNREKGKKKSHCRDCVNKDNLLRYHTNDETKKAHARAAHKYRVKAYGIDIIEYDRLLAEQGGVCAICGQPDKRKLSIDHCHKTGYVRALLCNGCNTSIRQVKENIDTLKSIIEYLEVHNARLGI